MFSRDAMFFSRALLVVFKTTGGKAWNPPGGLRPLSEPQRRNRKKNIEQVSGAVCTCSKDAWARCSCCMAQAGLTFNR